MLTFVCEGALIATTVCSSNSLMLRTSLLVTYAYVRRAKEDKKLSYLSNVVDFDPPHLHVAPP